MLSNVVGEDTQKSSVSGSDSIVLLLISNYPLSNGGYLVSFGRDDSDGSFKSCDPVHSSDFDSCKPFDFLERSSTFLPEGCYYLPEVDLADFIHSLSTDASHFEMQLLPAAGKLQGLLLVKVDEASLLKYEPEEED